MQLVRGVYALAVLCMLAATTAGAVEPSPALVAAAEKEGQVIWYTGLIVNQIVRPMVAAFEAKYPTIRVLSSRASNTDTTLKILTEARAHRMQADVFDVTSGIFPLLDAHVVAFYAPESAVHFPAAY